ncbi:MAG: response regulator [Methanotrichaceae archaeon]
MRAINSYNTINIIIAEDDPLNQKIAIKMLKKLGYHADVASNGIEVLKALENQVYDIVLMDIQMPGMDGIEAIRIIRKCWSPGPRIIVATAFALDTCRDLCNDVGADDLLAKPLKKEELKAAIERNMCRPSDTLLGLQPIAPELST